MSVHPAFRRVQGLFWEHNRPLRALARRLRRELSLAIYRVRDRFAGPLPTRVVTTLHRRAGAAIDHPAIAVVPVSGAADAAPLSLDEHQTETSVEWSPFGDATREFVFHAGPEISSLPATYLESLLMAACAEDLDWVVGGWAPPAPGRYGPSGVVSPPKGGVGTQLVRTPISGRRRRRAVTGRVVPHICAEAHLPASPEPEFGMSCVSGAHRLRLEMGRKAVVRSDAHEIDVVLGDLPRIDGPPTALFLLPYLAVGGAERLLMDLLRGFGDRYRSIIATTDPHRRDLGQTVDRFRELTPHVYTLGDWLPREAVPSAIRHLLRRWSAEALVSWNGTVDFYDHVDTFKGRFPYLRIVNQIYNHRGGWIEHFCPTVVRSIDRHIAVNTPIARALENERGVPQTAITTIFHGVEVPDEPDVETHRQCRAERRAGLGLPQDALVVGSFIRLHPQKRPLDIVEIAARMTGEAVHFLLVGGGALDRDIDREIGRRALPNITRLQLQDEIIPLYDALDLCLMTSEFEGLPVFLLDGLARSLPCVATGVGDIPLLLEHGGGAVVDRPGDIDGLVAAIRSFMDPDVRRSEGQRGRQTVLSRFSVDRFVRDTEAAIFPEP